MRCTRKIISFAATPLGFCRLARAYPSRNLDSNSLSVGTSFFGSGRPCCSKCRSRSSPHRWAADFERTGALHRSRCRSPFGRRNLISASHPPFRYGRTKSRSSPSSFRRRRGLLAEPVYQRILAEEYPPPNPNDAGKLLALGHSPDGLFAGSSRSAMSPHVSRAGRLCCFTGIPPTPFIELAPVRRSRQAQSRARGFFGRRVGRRR